MDKYESIYNFKILKKVLLRRERVMADANKAVNKKNNQKHNTERVKNHRHRKSTEEREGNGKFDSRNRYLPKRDSIRDENNFRRRGIMQGNGNPSFYQEPMAIVPQGSYPNHYPEPGKRVMSKQILFRVSCYN
ncbi:hypothetical protein JTB14_027764 [Gonioctena quinquepunctata]|nr:hypothetical protein JTB14_027764 [Gonioctena quinquepunctata]